MYYNALVEPTSFVVKTKNELSQEGIWDGNKDSQRGLKPSIRMIVFKIMSQFEAYRG